MAEHFSFFDPVEVSPGVWDREYNAPQFTKYFGALVTTGVMKGMGNMLAVSANGSNMVTKINTGIAFIEGKYYENDSFLDLTHDTETLGNSRIDRIVVRMDDSIEARYVRAFIKKGVPSTNPAPPVLTQTPTLYEISLAQVRVVGGQTFISTNAVTDERGTNVICPWAGSNILPSYDDNALAKHLEEKASKTAYGHVKIGTGINVTADGTISAAEVRDASTTVKGIVQLNNTLTSTSAAQAATANTVKQVNDKFVLPTPIALPLLAGWSNSEAVNPLSYFKDAFGVVHLYGRIKRANGNSSINVATLPVGYRPIKPKESQVVVGIGYSGYIDIGTDGAILIWMDGVTTNVNAYIDAKFSTTV